MANSFNDAQCVNGNGFDCGQIICDPFPVIDKETLISVTIGLLVAASPIGGLIARGVGGIIVGKAVTSAARKFLK